MTNVVIIGGGPGGYEAALVGKQLGGNVTLVERRGLGGSAVLTDVVPSKTLSAVAEVMTRLRGAGTLGLRLADGSSDLAGAIQVNMSQVHQRIRELAQAQSQDIDRRLRQEGVRVVHGTARCATKSLIIASTESGDEVLPADVLLIATGARPRELPAGRPDGERIFTWAQIYDMDTLPERLVIVGSGVTGAEFASAYRALGVEVTLISSRHQVLPSQDPDAAALIQSAFEERGIAIYNDARAVSAQRKGSGVVVSLEDGREIEGSHCLMAVGAIPNTHGIGLEELGVDMTSSGRISVDRVSRTSVRGVYAAGDCTDSFALASVAAMQGRIAMWHSLGDAVTPLNLKEVASNVFTAPEIATVGVTQAEVDSGAVNVRSVCLPLRGNARAKMKGLSQGFVKIFCLPTTNIIVGGVVVSRWASELIHSLSVAVKNKLTADQFAESFTVYPSLTGSIAEAARQLHRHDGESAITY
ncbi:MAG: NAD(P)H-quinone dehydrogenase [Bifidobacteriaceae bacterium]|jgi:dihydrolipoamide dehydrogenase|nr:NAD(P)H-quinone dehydrogenase [Bifidobacteriaceae bacterium]